MSKISSIFPDPEQWFAEIILPLNLPKSLTYGIPVNMQPHLKIGMRVEVALGKNKIYTGIVAHITKVRPELYRIKPIKKILDPEPIIFPRQLKLWQWIAEYYLSSPGEVMQAALPAHLKPQANVSLIWTGLPPIDVPHLSDLAYVAAEALQIKKDVTLQTLIEIVGSEHHGKVVAELLENGLAEINDKLVSHYKVKTEKSLFLHPKYEDEEKLSVLFDELKNAPKQLQVLMSLVQMQKLSEHITPADLAKAAQTSAAIVNALIAKGVIVVDQIIVDRIKPNVVEEYKTIQLTDAQKLAYENMEFEFQNYDVVLLNGITGSGKTLLYIQKINEVISTGKQALYLVPEIALTTQLLSRLQSFFGEKLGVYHSRFSNNERVEIWEKVRQKKYQVVIGARSAMWLPFEQLGLIVVDEEHDTSYKQQDPSPRFHARDAAISMAAFHQAKTILGTATPSIESRFNVEQKKYGYVELNERFGSFTLPEIKIISAQTISNSIHTELKTLSPGLIQAIQKHLKAGQQTILFQNRRGYSPFQICSLCGWVPHCKNCSVSLTYHKSHDQMRCHYCGQKSKPMYTCQSCGSNRLLSKTFGTEKLEEEVKQVFPSARVARMDWDSMRTRGSLPKLIHQMEKGLVDILVGTQMVVKGLDFDRVGLVGIISADGLLSYPDFRVHERAFQLMEQVSGRAGRKQIKGEVIIQAFKVDHPILKYVQAHDFQTFYEQELNERLTFSYPPFMRLIKVTARHAHESKVQQVAQYFVEQLAQNPAIHVQGPAPGIVPKVRNQYIFELLIKMPKDSKLMQEVKNNLRKIEEQASHLKGLSGVHVTINVDPF